ncbi:hypothetical protein PR048_014430 [Dryococelus australis]|uniref:Uncharacterized protein n=1 Tax=Dryococelus australis TaxID=614101 RepID=A0ABQ9HE80_9NEOP|nr:hypothetical protein PR048_014430 [Dryococelus australis]
MAMFNHCICVSVVLNVTVSTVDNAITCESSLVCPHNVARKARFFYAVMQKPTSEIYTWLEISWLVVRLALFHDDKGATVVRAEASSHFDGLHALCERFRVCYLMANRRCVPAFTPQTCLSGRGVSRPCHTCSLREHPMAWTTSVWKGLFIKNAVLLLRYHPRHHKRDAHPPFLRTCTVSPCCEPTVQCHHVMLEVLTRICARNCLCNATKCTLTQILSVFSQTVRLIVLHLARSLEKEQVALRGGGAEKELTMDCSKEPSQPSLKPVAEFSVGPYNLSLCCKRVALVGGGRGVGCGAPWPGLCGLLRCSGLHNPLHTPSHSRTPIVFSVAMRSVVGKPSSDDSSPVRLCHALEIFEYEGSSKWFGTHCNQEAQFSSAPMNGCSIINTEIDKVKENAPHKRVVPLCSHLGNRNPTLDLNPCELRGMSVNSSMFGMIHFKANRRARVRLDQRDRPSNRGPEYEGQTFSRCCRARSELARLRVSVAAVCAVDFGSRGEPLPKATSVSEVPETASEPGVPGLNPFEPLLSSHEDDPGSIPGRVTPDFRMWESYRTMRLMRLIGGFSRGSPVSLALHSCSILTSITLIGFRDLPVDQCVVTRRCDDVSTAGFNGHRRLHTLCTQARRDVYSSAGVAQKVLRISHRSGGPTKTDHHGSPSSIRHCSGQTEEGWMVVLQPDHGSRQ